MFGLFKKLLQIEKSAAEQEVAPAEPIDFNFKKEINKRIREDIRPFLVKNGFKMRKPATYIRERNGLLQEICFVIHKSNLRTWSSFMPLYMPWLNVMTWGTSSSYVDSEFPDKDLLVGYDDVWVSDWPEEKTISDYENKALPRFYELTASIKNAIVPEMDRVSSIEFFLDIVESDGFLWGRRTGRSADDAIIRIGRQTGAERVKSIVELATTTRFLPKPIREYIISAEPDKMNDAEADQWFHAYCNYVREYCKLPTLK